MLKELQLPVTLSVSPTTFSFASFGTSSTVHDGDVAGFDQKNTVPITPTLHFASVVEWPVMKGSNRNPVVTTDHHGLEIHILPHALQIVVLISSLSKFNVTTRRILALQPVKISQILLNIHLKQETSVRGNICMSIKVLLITY